MQINIEVFHKVTLYCWFCVARPAQSTQNKFAYLCNISRKTWGMKLMFLNLDKQKRLLQVNSIILGVCIQACPKYPK